jgi:antitoxin (DNA-binding transcriptional repressor) of toxin-antitoxin stability system
MIKADAFRERLGHWIDRVAAGESLSYAGEGRR